MLVKQEKVGLEKQFFDLAVEVATKEGLEIYDVEFLPGSGMLRIYIFNKETKTALIDDCVRVDHALTPYIDTLSWIPETLTLEVSSPGVYRDLSSIKHFEMVLSEQIEIVVTGKFESPALKGQKKFKGILLSVSDDSLVINYKDKNEITVPFEVIKKANSAPEIG